MAIFSFVQNYSRLLFLLIIPYANATPFDLGVYSLEEYCNKFMDIFKPYICRAIIFPSTTTQLPWWNTTTTTEVWEEDCNCDLTCRSTQNSDESNSEESEYICQSCGSNCPVNVRIPPRCTCAVLGRSKKARCKCTANCASFRYLVPMINYDDSSTSCIFNVNSLDNGIFGDNSTDHTCECTKSKSAENSTMPYFVCVCQPTN